MKTSELIKLLEENLQNHGDIPVFVQEEGFGGYSLVTIINTIVEDISTYNITETIDEGNLTIEEAQKIFPELTEENYEEIDSTIECIVIKTGSLLYNT